MLDPVTLAAVAGVVMLTDVFRRRSSSALDEYANTRAAFDVAFVVIGFFLNHAFARNAKRGLGKQGRRHDAGLYGLAALVLLYSSWFSLHNPGKVLSSIAEQVSQHNNRLLFSKVAVAVNSMAHDVVDLASGMVNVGGVMLNVGGVVQAITLLLSLLHGVLVCAMFFQLLLRLLFVFDTVLLGESASAASASLSGVSAVVCHVVNLAGLNLPRFCLHATLVQPYVRGYSVINAGLMLSGVTWRNQIPGSDGNAEQQQAFWKQLGSRTFAPVGLSLLLGLPPVQAEYASAVPLLGAYWDQGGDKKAVGAGKRLAQRLGLVHKSSS